MFSQYGQLGEPPLQPLTTRVFVGLAEGGAAALKGEVVGKVVKLRDGERVNVRDTVPVGDPEEEKVEAEDGKGRHRGPRANPAIPELRIKPVTLLS